MGGGLLGGVRVAVDMPPQLAEGVMRMQWLNGLSVGLTAGVVAGLLLGWLIWGRPRNA